jgi:hypothetical protein
MKKISELSEKEILDLTTEDVELMIKLKKAEEGIKLLPKPKEPTYFDIKAPDVVVYSCTLFGDNLVFEDIEEFNKVLNVIKNTASKYRLEYNWNKLGSDFKYATKELKQPYNGEWHTTTSNQVYSVELYNEIVDLAAQNKKLKEQYEKELKEYESAINDAKWIEDEINEKVLEVKEKFWKLESYCRKFKYDYLPLSNENETVAMNFMDKAYSLTDEQKDYVLANYSSI